MSTIAKALTEEIQRITKKELGQVEKLFKQSLSALEKQIREQAKRVDILERSAGDTVVAVDKGAEPVSAKQTVKPKITPRNIKSLRKKLGVSQAKLADMLGVSLGIVTIWENKKDGINIKSAKTRNGLLELMEKTP